MAIIDILEIGRQGLNANRKALQTTSNNIANANTPGYTREVPKLVSSHTDSDKIADIPGVEVAKVYRVHDDFLQNQIMEENKSLGNYKARSEAIKRVENAVYNESFKIGDLVNKFFNDLKELSTNPETFTLRTQVIASAKNSIEGFKLMNSSMKRLQSELDERIKDNIRQVNMMGQEIADLNGSILEIRASGREPLELLDKRDELLRELSQKIGGQFTFDEKNNANFVAGGVGVLVNGTNFNSLEAIRSPERANKSEGSLDIYLNEHGTTRPLTNVIKDGELGGMIHVRDDILTPSLHHLDVIAFSMAHSINDIHREGVGSDGKGQRNFFNNLDEVTRASEKINLDPEILKSAENLAVGLENAPGDNRIALKMSQLETVKVLPDAIESFVVNNDTAEENKEHPKTHTITDSINNLIGKIGIESQNETGLYEHEKSIVDQLENYRESISGVNLEEEAVNMLKYQTVFHASAKAMKVGDELFQTILTLKS